MKWIGQHIYDLVSRFRSDVYLENIPTGTIASGGNLGLDSNNKIVKANEASGDITGVTISSDGLGLSYSSGEAGFTIAGGNAITTSVSVANTVTIDHDDTSSQASINNSGTRVIQDVTLDTYGHVTGLGTYTIPQAAAETLGLASFNSDDFTVSTGAVSLIDLTVNHLAASTLVLESEGISSNDNDTTIPTSAAVKDYTDGKYSYAYMTWSASAKPTRDGSNNPEWMLPHTGKGIYEEDWNNDSGVTSTTVGTTTYSFSRYHAVNSLVVPHDGILCGFHAHGRNDDTDLTFKAGLFHADGSTTGTTNASGIDYGNTTATNEFTLRYVATADEVEASGGTDGTTGHNFRGPCKLVSNTDELAVTAGDALMPAIMGSSSNSTDEIFITMTIILKIPIV